MPLWASASPRLGVTAKCARSSKPPPKKVSFFFKSISADARAKQLAEKFKTDADARKLAREQQKAADISLAFEQNGAGNTTWITVRAQEECKKFQAARLRELLHLSQEAAGVIERELPAVLVPMPAEVIEAEVLAAQLARKRKLPRSDRDLGQKRKHVNWRREHPGRVQQALAMVEQKGGGVESCSSALSTLQADEVLNPDGLFDSLTLGTLRGWIQADRRAPQDAA